MNHRELEIKLSELIRQERSITNEILRLINIALEKRSYLELGYSSMFDWLVRGFGFSNAAAHRRIEAARMLKAVPGAAEKLSQGLVNLSTLSKAQTIIKHHEKVSGLKVTASEKAEIVESIENKSMVEAEQTLIEKFPDAASEVYQERKRVIDDKTIRYQLNLPNEATENLKRAKEILSHKFHNASDADIIAYALAQLIERIDPVEIAKRCSKERTTKPKKPDLSQAAKPTSPSMPTASSDNSLTTTEATSTSAAEVTSKRGIRLNVFSKSNAKCSFKDPHSGRVCGSTYQIQIDHIRPRALGGGDKPENLRALCRQHNMLAAERSFGRQHMNKFRRPT